MPTASCVDGADLGVGGDPETVSYTATSAITVFLVVDSWTSSEEGGYSLTVSVTP